LGGRRIVAGKAAGEPGHDGRLLLVVFDRLLPEGQTGLPASFPDMAGEVQRWAIETLTADEVKNTTTVAGGRGSAYNLYRRAK
jgi:hypothetical protein